LEHLPLWDLCQGNLDWEKSTGDPEVYVEEGSRVGHFSSLGLRWGSLNWAHVPRNFERWMKGDLEVKCLFVRELCEWNMEGRLFYWGLRSTFQIRLLKWASVSIGLPLLRNRKCRYFLGLLRKGKNFFIQGNFSVDFKGEVKNSQ